MTKDNNIIKSEEDLFSRVTSLIEDARRRIAKVVNTTMVYTYYGVGQYIIEYEQGGKIRAEYGKQVLKRLSERLIERFGEDDGWSVETLTKCKKFFKAYSVFSTPRKILELSGKRDITNKDVKSLKSGNSNLVHSVDQIQNSNSVCTADRIQSDNANFVCTADEIPTSSKSDDSNFVCSADEIQDSNLVRSADPFHKFVLTWNHYQILMRVKNEMARSFYEIEAYDQQWSYRQLQRQVSSSLFERLALSRDKDEVMRLANDGQTVEKPEDILKDPLVLEFAGLKPDASYSETDLEGALISRMKDFLLELGKGFLFEARQKRFTFDEEHFYVDLVFYNRLLQCYVLIDIKTDKLTHQDLGQMQMYVNYFDRYVKQDFEKPTIGILLCETKNDALVELTLPKDANIYAQQYELFLPDKQLLQSKMREWIAEYREYKERQLFSKL